MTHNHTYGSPAQLTLEDGRKLHYWKHGEGGPTVVFESGMGFSGYIWGQVQPEVAKLASTVVYDRAGLGRSDDRKGPSDLAAAVADLAALLRSLSSQSPFVLVGASWGGNIIRALAAEAEFPIRGLVLVDQSDENAPEYFEPEGRKRFESMTKFMVPMAKLGFYRLIGLGVGKKQPKDVRRDLLTYDFTVRSAQAMQAEIKGFLQDMQSMKDNPSRLEGVKVSVISGTKVNWMERKQRPAVNRAHKLTAESLAQGRFVEARNSGHYVMFDQPELVVSEIARVLGV